MENSILNVAHEKQRKADALLHQGHFEEAAECHMKVADLLTQAHEQFSASYVAASNSDLWNKNSCSIVPSVYSRAALESLVLQRDYHEKQAAIVRMKRAQYEDYEASLKIQQKNLLGKQIIQQCEKNNATSVLPAKLTGSLRQAIYKTIDEQDNLLSLISLPDDGQAFKHPKDNNTVIEELRTANAQLRSLVESLLTQLEAKEQHIRELTRRLQTVSGGENGTYPDDGQSLRLAPLPPLAPLEMPLFDFTA
ncbi:hypothetical protein PV327_001019 [Microctonus hyperodae]|uniref:Nuclear receptor-binding factor 2 MIT domain-containing protein n=2 Tax=Microctonus hyperodae TaxID=165561 RepID=A0AA39G7Q2_MICHY|nr:hypothetical protein PV327_001019 [Microctonus hyperodae]